LAPGTAILRPFPFFFFFPPGIPRRRLFFSPGRLVSLPWVRDFSLLSLQARGRFELTFRRAEAALFSFFFRGAMIRLSFAKGPFLRKFFSPKIPRHSHSFFSVFFFSPHCGTAKGSGKGVISFFFRAHSLRRAAALSEPFPSFAMVSPAFFFSKKSKEAFQHSFLSVRADPFFFYSRPQIEFTERSPHRSIYGRGLFFPPSFAREGIEFHPPLFLPLTRRLGGKPPPALRTVSLSPRPGPRNNNVLFPPFPINM